MNAPILWIFIPFLAGFFLLLFDDERTTSIVGGVTALLLAVAAYIIPIDEALRLGEFSFKIASSMQILGRSLSLSQSDASFLAIVYAMTAFWFFGAEMAGVAKRLVPLGLSFIALLVASIAVVPFLFAALLIEIGVLLSVPMLLTPNISPGRGILRFIIHQTLAMPCILFAGWMLAGVEASPSDLIMVAQSAMILGLGFAFLLAIFPFYSWIPMLAEETSPYVLGFLLWSLPTVTIIFGMSFLDRYSWIRSSPQFMDVLFFSGILMVVTGGAWAAFQNHLGRVMAYASIAETGFVLLALSFGSGMSLDIVFLPLIPRGLGFAVWALSLSLIEKNVESLAFSSVEGLLRTYPFATAGIILSNLSVMGFPLLAGFPPRFALWQALSGQSIAGAFWLGLGLFGLLIGALRSLAALSLSPENKAWEHKETPAQILMLGCGIAGLFLLGVFPQIVHPLLEGLPLMFAHLGQ